MKKTMYGAVTVGVALMLAAPVFAQAPAAREAMREKAQEVREAAKGKVEEAREAAKELREGVRKEAETKREELREVAKTLSKEARDEMKKAREAVKAKVEANRKELQVKLKTIKDERKRGIVETLADKFDKLNAGRVLHFGEVLDKLVAVLGRISARAAKAKTVGKDVAPVEAAVAAAQKVIDDARAAVKAQAEKVYKVVVTEETKLKDDLGKVRDAYQADVRAAEAKVKDAREAVHAAARTLAGVPGIGELKETPAPVPVAASVAQ